MFILFLVIIFLIGILVSTVKERNEWNNGICQATGKPWEYFDTDSQGGRGYKSNNNVIWVTIPFKRNE